MKPLFPLLLSYVLMTSQTFAISGGPVFTNTSASVPGIYSGVLQGVSESTGGGAGGAPAIPGDPVTPVDGASGTASNAIGLFDLTVPATSLATGTFLLFADGTVFGGTIDASGDLDSGEIKGILQGDYTFNTGATDATGVATTVAVNAQARGRLDAQVSSTTALGATSLARLIGTADLGISFGDVDPQTFQPITNRTISFDVTGYKQSN